MRVHSRHDEALAVPLAVVSSGHHAVGGVAPRHSTVGTEAHRGVGLGVHLHRNASQDTGCGIAHSEEQEAAFRQRESQSFRPVQPMDHSATVYTTRMQVMKPATYADPAARR